MNKKLISEYINKNKFNPSKKMGQNFLNNEEILKKMISLSEVQDFSNVIEIGPGLGSLTKYLAQLNIYLTIVELDKRLFEYIKNNIVGLNQINYVNDDFLKLDLAKTLNPKKSYHVIANLPYSISTLILAKIALFSNINKVNVLVQKEMAERITSNPRTKAFNAMSVFFQSIFDTRKLLLVHPENFNPQPKVDSYFIELSRKPSKIDPSNLQQYNKFLKLCFLNRRKKMSNNLKQAFDLEKIKNIYRLFGLSDNIRAEEIDVATFMKLFEAFYA